MSLHMKLTATSRSYCLLGLLCVVSPAAAQEYTIDTIAGGKPLPTPVAALKASIAPASITTDNSGNYYFFSLGCLYKVDLAGVRTRIAGDGRGGSSGDGGPALNAEFNLPQSIAVDGIGNIYIADQGNHSVRQVAPDGTISTVVKGLSAPNGLATDASGNLYITDSTQNTVFKRTPAGNLTTVAGNGTFGSSGDGGLGLDAQVGGPQG
jgi:hypothetical protein